MSPDVQAALLSFFGTVISGAVSMLAIYAQQHWKIQNDATRNAAIAAYATRLAPLVIDQLGVAVESAGKLTANHPVIKAFGDKLIEGYPEFAAGIGLTPTKAANFVLAETQRLLQFQVSQTSPAPSPVVVDADPVKVPPAPHIPPLGPPATEFPLNHQP